MTQFRTVILVLYLMPVLVLGQSISINEDGSAPDPSAMLDVNDTTSGVLVPRLTQAQRDLIANPATGLLIFQIDSDSGFYFNQGTATSPNWLRIKTELDTNYWIKSGSNLYYNQGSVGIGTNTPQDQLHVHENSTGASFATFTNNLTGSSTTDGLVMGYASGSIGAGIFNYENSNLSFGTNNAYRMYLTPSGRLGVGEASPSDQIEAFSSSSLRIRSSTSSDSYSGFVAENSQGEYFMGVQSTADGSSGEFHIYQNNGSSKFGQRMVIDHDGRIGIGLNDPEGILSVSSTPLSGVPGLFLDDFSSTEGSIAVDDGEGMYFGEWNNTTSTFTENMRIDNSGRVGINTNNINAMLTIQGTGGDLTSGLQLQNVNDDWYMYQNTSFELVFRDDATDRLQIDANGNLLPAADNIYDLGSATQRWGDVYATNGSILTSDIRFKTNIRELSYGLKEVLSIRPITFNWKEDLHPETKIGLSAQELLEIVPEVVKTHKWEKNENGEWVKKKLEKYGVYYTDLIPILIKAIQEQEAEIEDLKGAVRSNQEDINMLKAEIEKLKQARKP